MPRSEDPLPPVCQESFFSSLGEIIGLVRLLDFIPDTHFFAKDRHGRFVAANRASLRRHGVLSEADILGKTDRDFHPPELAAAYVNEDRHVMSTGRPLPEQAWLIHDHLGERRWFVSSKIPLRDRAGRVVGVAGMMRPIGKAGGIADAYQELGPAIGAILDGYHTPLRIDALAAAAGLSVSAFERRFKQLFHVTPTGYLLNVRVNAARALLEHETMPLAEVATRCGFYDQSQMGKIFRRQTGFTPAAYRALHRPKAPPR